MSKELQDRIVEGIPWERVRMFSLYTDGTVNLYFRKRSIPDLDMIGPEDADYDSELEENVIEQIIKEDLRTEIDQEWKLLATLDAVWSEGAGQEIDICWIEEGSVEPCDILEMRVNGRTWRKTDQGDIVVFRSTGEEHCRYTFQDIREGGFYWRSKPEEKTDWMPLETIFGAYPQGDIIVKRKSDGLVFQTAREDTSFEIKGNVVSLKSTSAPGPVISAYGVDIGPNNMHKWIWRYAPVKAEKESEE